MCADLTGCTGLYLICISLTLWLDGALGEKLSVFFIDCPHTMCLVILVVS